MTTEESKPVSRSGSNIRVAVIGAGLAGLSCAKELKTAGLDVTVFEKSRGLGGRVATRRAGQFAFDHGAQYITARSTAFSDVLEANKDALAKWTPRESGGGHHGDWLVGTPGMSMLGKCLADDLIISKSTRIIGVNRSASHWHLRSEGNAVLGPFDLLAVAIPAPQVSGLLATGEIELPTLNDVVMAPCWALMLAFDRATQIGFDIARPVESPVAWIARNDTKPGRNGMAEQWVIQASTQWSRDHLEEQPEKIAVNLLAAFQDLAPGDLPQPAFSSAHRWRYARVEKPLGQE